MIPKILHQIDLLGDKNNSWKEKHPNWKYILWSNDRIIKFISKEYPDYLSVYKKGDKKVELAMCLILNHYGGLCVSWDTVCLKNVDNIIKSFPNKKVFLSGIPPLTNVESFIIRAYHNISKDKEMISNKIAMSEKHHIVWKCLVDNIKKGKQMCINNSYEDVMILPHYYFEPCYSNDKKCKPIEESHAKRVSQRNLLLELYFDYLRNIQNATISLLIIFFVYLMTKIRK